MPRTDLEKFQCRLALVDYFRHVFGVKDINKAESVRRFYDDLEVLEEGYKPEGRSHVAAFLQDRVSGIAPEDLLRYDENVERHTQALNRHRPEPIKLKYFQILAALMTEHYLDRFTDDADAFLADLNTFVEKQNTIRGGYDYLPSFEFDDLNKLAFWMATGSGKTLVMHINYYQYLDYQPDASDNILLVTPNAGLSEQHMTEMGKSGIPCRRFNADTSDLFSNDPQTVKVIEITKLVEEKTGEGKSVDVAHLEGRNLVFVDEGHKGAGSQAQAWRSRRAAIAENGFTFEYSATFGQGVGGAGTDIEEEYGKAIIIDYSYPRFYKDGYGKDYRILNLEQSIDPSLTNRYLLANLLTFYEQVRCYAGHRDLFSNEFNVDPPLLTFVGHTVTAGKTRSQLSQNDKRSLSDVQELVLFLHHLLHNENNWVPRGIDAILAGEAGLSREDGRDLFSDAFRTLRQPHLNGDVIYKDMLQQVFHVPASARLYLFNIKSAQGEIALRAGVADRFFGLINIGDAANFLNLAVRKMPEIAVEEEQLSGSLFHTINQQGSPINILIGARKFIEGWDSWRVSTMGLMNIGRGEGPQIIQLFGRGVRLLGKDRTLKRSTELDVDAPDDLRLLETLNIFGLRARYMARFRDYLAEEGIDVEQWETITINTGPGADFEGKGLLVIRRETGRSFEEAVRFSLAADGVAPNIDLIPRADRLVSDGLNQEMPGQFPDSEARVLPPEVLPLFNWERLYHDTWRFAAGRGYRNLALDRDTLKSVMEEENYDLLCHQDMVELASFADVGRLENIALMILRKYVEQCYATKRRRWEERLLNYRMLDDNDQNLIPFYEASVKHSAHEFFHTLHKMRDDPELFRNEQSLPKRVHFDRHLYHPLLVKDPNHEPTVKYFPPGLNDGERKFVKQLRDYVRTDEGQALLADHDRELFLLRNQSRGRGVGFLVNHDRFFPDFILWLMGPSKQDIVFIEPHGLLMDKHPKKNPKIQFYDKIKDYQQMLNQRANRDDISLHSYIVSQTPLSILAEHFNIESAFRWNSWHVYLPDQDYVVLILKDVLAGI